VRFPNAVLVGKRVRARCRCESREVKGGVQITELYTVEIEGETKPELRRRSDHAALRLKRAGPMPAA
jgi:acyl dehydratase